jgi:hypothetical protein
MNGDRWFEKCQDLETKVSKLEQAIDFLNKSIKNVAEGNKLVQDAFEAQGEPSSELFEVFAESFNRLGLVNPDA